MICFIIFREIIYSSLLCGYLSNRLSLGLSVAKAKLPNESIIKFNHSKWILYSGLSNSIQLPMKAVASATQLMVS